MTLIFNPSAFKHGETAEDIETATATAIYDEVIEGYKNKYLLVGFDVNRNPIEVMYNLVDDATANVFHAMKCRKELLRRIKERGYYADFN